MRHLIIYMHPSKESFNGAILEEYTKALTNSGHDVLVRALSEYVFSPFLTKQEYEDSLQEVYTPDVVEEHQHITWADAITFIFPLWWGGLPAIGKGYVDRVFSYGFAYRLKEESPVPKLTGKKVATICTTGSPSDVYREQGMHEAINRIFDKGIFQFCGLEVHNHRYFGNVILCSDEERKKMLAETKELARSWEKQ
ncbi:NAD(P)H-dependent oxidoreductase [Alteribacter populi]|uniref:NAD(P)H-dependent oxidoreductase n=1 Tax=Alteribacter populi TaxID=2011011 RepID=UPI000BBA4242|nr:NAD(P)H-dependent oxidoreductase [Alteribacter populi]